MLNVGTRFKIINKNHVQQALEKHGIIQKPLAYANHDYRDIRPDIKYMTLLMKLKLIMMM